MQVAGGGRGREREFTVLLLLDDAVQGLPEERQDYSVFTAFRVLKKVLELQKSKAIANKNPKPKLYNQYTECTGP